MQRHILVNGSYAGSLILFRAPLLKALVAKGYRVSGAAPDMSASTKQELIELGVEPHSIPLARNGLSLTGDLKYILGLRKLIRAQNVDFVLNYTIKPNIWGSFAAYICGVQSASMVTGLGFAFIPQARLKNRLVQRFGQILYRWAMKTNRNIVFQNPDDMADFIQAKCLPNSAKAFIVNGSGVDIDEFQPKPLPPLPTFLLIARLLWAKGIKEYVSAAQLVKQRHPEARFLLAGPLDGGPDGIAQHELDQFIQSGIEYMGTLKDVRGAIEQANVYVLPSYREGTPRTVLEAMAMGRPIVTTDAPGCRETTKHGENGLLVPVGEVQGLADAMLTLAPDPDLRKSMGAASRIIAVEKYGADNVARDLIEKLGL